MAHPGRPRGRMNKKTIQAQAAAAAAASQAEQIARVQQAQAHAQAQRAAAAHMGGPPNHHHPQHQDPGIQLHDEADLISFRTDALVRYISNHEYIENVTSKLIHTSKIIPPSLYPIIPKISDYENLKPEDIYFGDLSAMKYVENKLMNRLEAMKDITNNENVRYLVDSESYNFQKESQKKLAGLQRNLTDKESVTALEQELDKVLSEYNAKFKQNYKVVPAVHQYSISVDKLAPNLDVTSAPENYNPKSINSFININNDSNNSNENTLAHNDNGAGSFGNDDLSSFQFGNNIDTSKFNGFNGISMNQFDSNFLSINGSSNTNENNSDRDQTNNSLPPQDLGSNENSNNITTNNSDSNINTNTSNNDNNSLQNEDDGDDNVDNDDDVNIKSDQDSQNRSDNGLDMNDLFNDDGRGDMDHSAIVNDDMGDLYDFETGGNGGDDDELMGGTEFEQDFLNQIDHSME
ncbi:hypothetical protein SBY92_001430 [Candida maltosa Xu316]